MDKVINMNELIGAAAGDRQHMLGKFLYFSLTNLLVDKDELAPDFMKDTLGMSRSYLLTSSRESHTSRRMVPSPMSIKTAGMQLRRRCSSF